MRIHGIVNVSTPVASLPAVRAPVGLDSYGSIAQGAPEQPGRLEQPQASGQPLPVLNRVTTSAFITPQSLATFPFASGLVVGIWHVAKLLFPKGAESPWVGLVIAVFIGLLVYLISVSDRRVHLDWKQKLVGFGIAVINCVYLFMAAAGTKAFP